MDKFKTAREALKKIFTQFNNNLGLYTTVFVTVTYHLISERDFACSCKPQNQRAACFMHLFLPVGLLWVLLLLLDKALHQAVGNRRRHKGELDKPVKEEKTENSGEKNNVQQENSDDNSEPNEPLTAQDQNSGKTTEPKTKSGVPDIQRASCLVAVSVFYTLSVSSIWMAIVFLDGDWWLCCRNNGSVVQALVACKSPDARTVEEKSIAADMKSWSMNIGLLVLLGAAIIVAITKVCEGCKCKTRDDELAERIFEEGLGVVVEMQHKAALDQLKDRVNIQLDKKKWKKCSEVVEELIIEIQQSKQPQGDHNIRGTNPESSKPESPSHQETSI